MSVWLQAAETTVLTPAALLLSPSSSWPWYTSNLGGGRKVCVGVEQERERGSPRSIRRIHRQPDFNFGAGSAGFYKKKKHDAPGALSWKKIVILTYFVGDFSVGEGSAAGRGSCAQPAQSVEQRRVVGGGHAAVQHVLVALAARRLGRHARQRSN